MVENYFKAFKAFKPIFYVGVFFVLSVCFYAPDFLFNIVKATAATVSGTVYSDEGTTAITSGPTVRIKVNGAGDFTAAANGSGVYSVDVGTLAASDVITVYLDGATPDAVTVTRSAGTSNITGIPLYQDRVIVRHEDAGPVTNANLGQYDGDDDADIFFTSNSNNLSVTTDKTLLVMGSYTPGGTVTATFYKQTTGTFTAGANALDFGTFTQSGGTFNASSGNTSIGRFLASGGETVMNISGGTWNHNSGTVIFDSSNDCCDGNTFTADFNSSITFNNIEVNVAISFDVANSPQLVFGSGDTATVLGNLTHTNGILNGTWALEGNLIIGSSADPGRENFYNTGSITFNGTGTQTYTHSGSGRTAKIIIDKASGTVQSSGSTTLNVGAFALLQGTFSAPTGVMSVGRYLGSGGTDTVFHQTGGTFTHNSGTVKFDTSNVCCTPATVTIDVNSSLTLGGMEVSLNASLGIVTSVLQLATGDSLVLTGDFTHSHGTLNDGSLTVQGNVSVASTADGGSTTLTFTGTNSQTWTDSGGDELNGDITINKASGTLTLASNADWNAASQDLTITSGTFSQGASYNLSTGAISVGASGVWSNTGTGDITLGGDVSNAGTITLDGGGATCGDSNEITLTSSNTTQRTWTGAGTFTLRDLTVSYMAGSLTAISSTDSGNNGWTIQSGCTAGVTISGTVYSDEGSTVITSGPTVRVKVNGEGDYSAAANGSGFYEIPDITVGAPGDVLTVYIDGATPDAVAVTRTAGTSADITGFNLYQNRVIVRHEDAGPITNANLDEYDSGDDADLGFTVTSGNLTVADGFKLIVWTGKSYTPGGTITTSPSSSAASADGDLLIQSSATLTTAGNDISIGGDFTNSGTLTVTPATNWWDSSWLSRRKITLNNSASSQNLVNFPLLVSLSSSNIDYAKTQNAGQDIRFVDADGTTLLSHEIEIWDEAGTSQVWVKVPQIDSGSITDHIWIYYDNVGASDGQSATAVWDSNYDAVWHMNSSGTSVPDSTSNNFDGVKGDSTHPASTTSGRINGAQSFVEGTTPQSIIATGLSPYTTFTVEFWLNQNVTDGYGTFLADSAGIRPGLYIRNSDNKIIYYDGTEFFSNAALTENTWYHLAVVRNGTSLTYYLNGAADASHTVGAGTIPFNYIGANGNTGEEFTGVLDEFRVSDSVRSADWIEATYNWTQNNASFNTFGSEQSYASANPTATFTATATGHSINNGTGNMYNVVFNGTGGGWSFSDSSNTITNDLTLTAGTLSGTTNITVSGGDVTGNGTINLTDGTFLVDGSGNFGGNSNWTFSSLAFGDGTGAATTTSIGSGEIIVASQFVVSANQTLDAGSKTFEIQASGEGGGGDWWNESWASRRQITLNNSESSENLTNFPILVALTSSNIDYSKTQNSGQDIRFVDADGITQLSHEIELWNESGTSYVWVKVPQIDSGSTTDFIWMYYNNGVATDGQNVTDVWSNNYKSVWHMNQDPATAGVNGILDSSADTNHGTDQGSMDASDLVTGRAGYALDFDGSNDFIYTSDQYTNPNDWTLSAWVKTSVASGTKVVGFENEQISPGTGYDRILYVDSNGKARMGAYDGGIDTVASTTTVSNNAWRYLAGTQNQTTNLIEIFVDGVSEGTAANDFAENYSGYWKIGAYKLGGWPAGFDGYFTGQIDEVRLSSVNRSADWIEAEYNWVSDPGSYNTFGNEEGTSSFTIDGTINLNTSTFEYTTSTSVVVVPLSYYNLTLNQSGATYQLPEGGLSVLNNLTITAGTLDLNTADENLTVNNFTNNGTVQASASGNFVVTGNWTNNGTFTHNSGTMTFSPVSESVIVSGGSAVNVFYNFTVSDGGGKTLLFEAGDETKFEGTLTLMGNGNDAGSLAIGSTTSTQWELWATGSIVTHKLVVQNSGCYSGTNIVPSNDTNLSKGNNGSCWSLYSRGEDSSPTGGGPGGEGSQGGGGAGGGGGGSDGQHVTIVQSAFGRHTGSPFQLSTSSNVTTGNTIVVFVATDPGFAPVAAGDVSDNQGNTYVRDLLQTNGGNGKHIAVFRTAATATGALTVTVNHANSFDDAMAIYELSGVDSSSPMAGSASATATGTAAATGSFTATGNGTILAFMAHDGTGSPAITENSAWVLDSENHSTFGYPYSSVHRNAISSTSYNAEWTIGNSSTWYAVAINYRRATGGSSGGGSSGGGGGVSP